jgi:hypothetical protein
MNTNTNSIASSNWQFPAPRIVLPANSRKQLERRFAVSIRPDMVREPLDTLESALGFLLRSSEMALKLSLCFQQDVDGRKTLQTALKVLDMGIVQT